MTCTMAALVLTNLLYVAGAVVVATLVSGLYVLLRRKPKSVESGIASFNRELQALAPGQGTDGDGAGGVPVQPVGPSGRARPLRPRGGVVNGFRRAQGAAVVGADGGGRRASGHGRQDQADRTSGGTPG